MAVIECPSCKKNVSNLAIKCPHCNEMITRRGDMPNYVAPRAPSNMIKKIITLLILLAAAGAIVYYVLPMFGINLL